MAILPENETTTFEEQVYVNPQVSLDESNAFIDNYRAAQLAKTNEIARETHDLGTDISSNLGGLTGGTGYWTSRYQTPQTNQGLSNLRATAQAKALNDALANEEAMWKNRYSNAQRAYQKRSAAAAKAAAASSPTSPTTQDSTIEDDVVTEDNTPVHSTDGGSITTAPNTEHGSDTSYVDVDGNWVTIYADGTKFVNGVQVTEPRTSGPLDSATKINQSALLSVSPMSLLTENQVDKINNAGRW